jgi:hypothetical protein
MVKVLSKDPSPKQFYKELFPEPFIVKKSNFIKEGKLIEKLNKCGEVLIKNPNEGDFEGTF